jgi:hypothetical protein
MAQTYYPFDSGAGANVTEAQWSKMAQNWLATGVIKAYLNELQVYADSTGMQTKVKSGAAWIKGHYFDSDAEEVIAIGSADSTNPRIDRVIIRLDWTANTIQLAVLQGTPAVSPTAPALTQNTAKWEISLAQVRVNATVTTIAATNVTDERTFSKNANAVQSGWIPLTLLNGWVGPAAPYTPPQYMLDSVGFIHLTGRLSGGTTTQGTIIATLPVGYRPRWTMSFPIVTNNGSGDQIGQIDIDANGNIIAVLVYVNVTVLDRISFPIF